MTNPIHKASSSTVTSFELSIPSPIRESLKEAVQAVAMPALTSSIKELSYEQKKAIFIGRLHHAIKKKDAARFILLLTGWRDPSKRDLSSYNRPLPPLESLVSPLADALSEALPEDLQRCATSSHPEYQTFFQKLTPEVRYLCLLAAVPFSKPHVGLGVFARLLESGPITEEQNAAVKKKYQ